MDQRAIERLTEGQTTFIYGISNAEEIGSGNSRTVFRLLDYPNSVFKVTRSEDNEREFAFYHALTEEDKKYFAAVKSIAVVKLSKKAAPITILEMEYVKGNEPSQDMWRAYPLLTDRFRDRYGLYDIHSGNYALVNNSPKIFDYGHYYKANIFKDVK